MDLVAACRDKARQEKMLCWLYDEDRWPSGAAGGYVTRDVRYRARHLLFTPVPYGAGEKSNARLTAARTAPARKTGYYWPAIA